MTKEEPAVLIDQRDGIATITLNRPEKLNALSEEVIAKLQANLDLLVIDESLRCVVLTGNGNAFCAGHDLREMKHGNHSEKDFRDLFARCSLMMQSLTKLPVPVIARVHGIATAAGCQLCAACDIVIASSSARFAVSGINQGLFCSTPAVELSRAINPKQAFEMLVTGRLVPAAEATHLGLVTRVVQDDQLDNAVTQVVDQICSKSGAAVRLGKAMYEKQLAMNIPDAYEFAGQIQAHNMMMADASEGIDAFLQKRRPIWKHQ